MKIFLYGLQSSGASLAAYLLGQMPETVAVVDLYSYEVMPRLEAPGSEHVVAKAVITTTHDLEDHRRNFRPDVSILVLRDPVQNYVSLGRKEYANDDGTMAEKFRRLERLFVERKAFDLVLEYESLITRREQTVRRLRGAGIPLPTDAFALPRRRREIFEYNRSHSQWCRERYGRGWHFGNVRGDAIKSSLAYKYASDRIHTTVSDLCPELYRHYRNRDQGSTRPPLTTARSLLRDVAVRPARNAIGNGMNRLRAVSRDLWQMIHGRP